MSLLTFAIPKGRLLPEVGALFERSYGVDPAAAFRGSRRLSWKDDDADLRFLSVRAGDVGTYVEQGAADLGVVGLDVLREDLPDVYQPLDLRLGACRLVLAAPRGSPPPTPESLGRGGPARIATRYPRITEAWFAARGLAVELVPLHGAIELAPSLGVADAVVDITETGQTLEQNGLFVLTDVLEVSARLIVNRMSLKLRPDAVSRVVRTIRRGVRTRP